MAALQTNSKTELGRETWRCAGFVSYLPPPLVSYNTATHEGRPDEEDHGRDQGDGRRESIDAEAQLELGNRQGTASCEKFSLMKFWQSRDLRIFVPSSNKVSNFRITFRISRNG